jgi:cellulose synthase/poly-beta-1,6-N-acetylglucosamine synthase-like glycosyltransferase
VKSAALRFHSSSEEVLLNWNNWVRQIHRWLSIAFTVAIIANVVAMVQERQAIWVGLLALFPLVLLLLTGLYMFVLPYAAKWRGVRGADG